MNDNNARLAALVVRLGYIVRVLDGEGIDKTKDDADSDALETIVNRLVAQGRASSAYISEIEELCALLETALGDPKDQGGEKAVDEASAKEVLGS